MKIQVWKISAQVTLIHFIQSWLQRRNRQVFKHFSIFGFDCSYLFEDWVGVKNLVAALPSSVKRVVLVSSIGVTKYNELPWR